MKLFVDTYKTDQIHSPPACGYACVHSPAWQCHWSWRPSFKGREPADRPGGDHPDASVLPQPVSTAFCPYLSKAPRLLPVSWRTVFFPLVLLSILNSVLFPGAPHISNLLLLLLLLPVVLLCWPSLSPPLPLFVFFSFTLSLYSFFIRWIFPHLPLWYF